MITCIIVDDQQEAIDVLCLHMEQVPEVSIKGCFTDAREALAFYEREKVDLVILDVEMPGFSGIDFLDTIRAQYGFRMPHIIFATGYHSHALAGFDNGVIDYLLKPVSLARLRISIARLLAVHVVREDLTNAFLFVESDYKKIRVNFADILYVEAAGNYIQIATPEKKHLVHESLTAISRKLPEKHFVKCHKSFIASVQNVRAVSATELAVGNGIKSQTIPLGPTYKESVMKRLGIQ